MNLQRIPKMTDDKIEHFMTLIHYLTEKVDNIEDFMTLIHNLTKKVNIKGGTWCKDAFKRIIWFLHDTICTTRLEQDVIKENLIYWSAFRPMGYQNGHFATLATYCLLKVGEMRYQHARLRGWNEVIESAYILPKKSKVFLV